MVLTYNTFTTQATDPFCFTPIRTSGVVPMSNSVSSEGYLFHHLLVEDKTQCACARVGEPGRINVRGVSFTCTDCGGMGTQKTMDILKQNEIPANDGGVPVIHIEPLPRPMFDMRLPIIPPSKRPPTSPRKSDYAGKNWYWYKP
jgi:hypothetical protein